MDKMYLMAYTNVVLAILETWGYHEMLYVHGLSSPTQAARVAYTIDKAETEGLSPTMAAILVWSLTMNDLIIPINALETKH